MAYALYMTAYIADCSGVDDYERLFETCICEEWEKYLKNCYNYMKHWRALIRNICKEVMQQYHPQYLSLSLQTLIFCTLSFVQGEDI